MKIIFLGTPYLAKVALEEMIRSRHEVIAVVTQPDKTSGRGRHMKFSPVKELALEKKIPLFQPVSIKDEKVLDELDALQADIFVVTAYAQKLPERLLHMAPFGCINIHPSMLPRYRGASPLRGPILNGDEKTGVTIMNVAYEFDSGDILLQEEIDMDAKETIRTLEPKVAQKGAEMLVEALDRIEEGTLSPRPQNEEDHTYIKQLDKEAGRINFNDDAVDIERQIRACDPWPSAFTSLDGKMFKIWDADVTEDDAEGVSPGAVSYVDKKNLHIKTGNGTLKVNEVQLEGKKRMKTEEFLRGKRIEKGYEFGK